MRFNHNLKLGAIFAFLLTGLMIWSFGPEGKALAQKVVITPKDSVAKVDIPVSITPVMTDSTVQDTTNQLANAMNDFHSILYPMWHEAYPKKDFKAIREQAPLFQKKLLVLIRIPAPTDLDEQKKQDFLLKRQNLAFYVDQYNVAAADTVDSALASAFEQMHWGYEELDKVFMVEIKQLDSFHETLYFLWHKALPAKDYKSVKETMPVLKAEMDSLMAFQLPSSCKDIKDDFEAKRTALKDAVYQLVDVAQKGTEKQIDDALTLMHEKFMDLSSVLK